MEYSEITIFQQSIETCADPAEIAKKVKLLFKCHCSHFDRVVKF